MTINHLFQDLQQKWIGNGDGLAPGARASDATRRWRYSFLYFVDSLAMACRDNPHARCTTEIPPKPKLNASFAAITPEDLEAAKIERALHYAEASMARNQPQYTTDVANPDVAKVMRTLQACSSYCPGSNGEREAMAAKVTAMRLYFGRPSIFWTFTPNPNGAIAISVWSRADLDKRTPQLGCNTPFETLGDLEPHNLPSPTFMSTIATGNAAFQAKYYLESCEILIEELFGFDVKRRRPKAKPGIFGHMEAIFFAEESQGRLTIHHHGLGWIIGMPRTQRKWEDAVANHDVRC